MERNHLISNVSYVDDKIALCVGEDDRNYDPVTVASSRYALRRGRHCGLVCHCPAK